MSEHENTRHCNADICFYIFQQVVIALGCPPVCFERLGTSQFGAKSRTCLQENLCLLLLQPVFGWIKNVLENHINFPCTSRLGGWLGIIQSQVIFGGFREFP